MSEMTPEPQNPPHEFNPELALDLFDQEIRVVRSQNKMAAVRLMFDKIVEKQKEGMKIEAVIKVLHQSGLSISVATLKSAMARIRRERGIMPKRKSSKSKSASARPAPTSPSRPALEMPEAEKEGFGHSLIRPTPTMVADPSAPVRKESMKERALRIAAEQLGPDPWERPHLSNGGNNNDA